MAGEVAQAVSVCLAWVEPWIQSPVPHRPAVLIQPVMPGGGRRQPVKVEPRRIRSSESFSAIQQVRVQHGLRISLQKQLKLCKNFINLLYSRKKFLPIRAACFVIRRRKKKALQLIESRHKRVLSALAGSVSGSSSLLLGKLMS